MATFRIELFVGRLSMEGGSGLARTGRFQFLIAMEAIFILQLMQELHPGQRVRLLSNSSLYLFDAVQNLAHLVIYFVFVSLRW